MPFKFHPHPSLSNRDVSRIAKELHELVSEEDLKRYADIVLEERDRGKCVRIELLCEEHPYIIELFDSGKEGRTRFAFVVYDGFDRKKEAGLLEVDGLRCATKPEMI